MLSNDVQPVILYLKQDIIQYSLALRARSSLRKLTTKFQCSYRRKNAENKNNSTIKENKHMFKITENWDAML
jgi:hypothetical protein